MNRPTPVLSTEVAQTARAAEHAFEIRRGATRSFNDHGWLKTFHSFSFGHYFDPDRMGWGSLRVFNDDRVDGGTGFPTHPHRNMDILSYVLEGSLEHRDSLHNHGVIKRYGVQYLSAGRGVLHSEGNASASEPLHFLQMWVQPEHLEIAPNYGQQSFSQEDVRNTWFTMASGVRDVPAPIRLDANAILRVAEIAAETDIDYEVGSERSVFLFCAEGRANFFAADETPATLWPGDAVCIGQNSRFHVSGTSHLVLWDVASLSKEIDK